MRTSPIETATYRDADAERARPLPIARMLVAFLLTAALAYIAYWTTDTALGDVKTDVGVVTPSAVQVAQVYVQGAFYAIVAIGIAVAAHIALPKPD